MQDGLVHRDLNLPAGRKKLIDLPKILGKRLEQLPHVLRLLSENHLRSGGSVTQLLDAIDLWLKGKTSEFEFVFQPNRILMHDTTCTPALADIAGLRDAMAEADLDPSEMVPAIQVDVSVDHSIAVDDFARSNSISTNMRSEFRRNKERYKFMKWAAQSMPNVRVHPPGTGIMHTLNLEQLARVFAVNQYPEISHPDMLLGTDSHTTMINGIGVLAWGVGGLEAESVMFGQAASLAFPNVVGVELVGSMPSGTVATDLALEVTHHLRSLDVTGSFVEFFGQGVSALTADARAVVANMAPEYGASTGFFATDKAVIDYLKKTGRPETLLQSIEPGFREMGLWFDPDCRPKFDKTVKIDLSNLRPSIAGPRRPQDRLYTSDSQTAVETVLGRPLRPVEQGSGSIPDGAVGIAAITSCTNTSDPKLLVLAGILARKAAARGLKPAPWVKTSLAPGSPSSADYLEKTDLRKDLASIGFDIVGFGCTTCIGNSGPLPDSIEQALTSDIAVAAVLSGNRNFPGRVHPKLNLGFLASPPLVIAYALKGHIQGDIFAEPLGIGNDGQPVMLGEIWPTEEEASALLDKAWSAERVHEAFVDAGNNKTWQGMDAPSSDQFPWDQNSTVLRRPKFASLEEKSRLGTYEAAPLMVLGDDMTTDHISPAGWIDPDSAAGQWLIKHGSDKNDLNVYASYRGNWEVMLRGLFTNRLAQNYLAKDLEIADTLVDGFGDMTIFEAGELYAKRGLSTVILAGERYGMGSSRDWAAKGVALLGARAVIAQSFERIHRSNLIGMGVLPLKILDDYIPKSADIAPSDRFQISLHDDAPLIGAKLNIVHKKGDGQQRTILVQAAVETLQEAELLRNGGVLPKILSDRLATAEDFTYGFQNSTN